MVKQTPIAARVTAPRKASKSGQIDALVGPVGPPSIEGGPEDHKLCGPFSFLLIDVEGKPESEPRGRASIARRKDGSIPNGARPWIRVPKTAHEWKHAIRAAVKAALPEGALPALPPVSFSAGFVFRFARPLSHYGTGRNAGKLKPRAAILEHTSKPDLDNLVKAVKDAIGNWGKCVPLVWCDDAQVNRYVGKPIKRYVRPGEVPGLTLIICSRDPLHCEAR